jgi:NhaA family Na+:H+ antiporter
VSDESPRPETPPEAWAPGLRVARLAARPLERFLRIEASSGVLLLASAAIAFVWASSPWADGYVRLWETPLGLRVGGFELERPLRWIVDDGLMAIFFFVVGLEIRREIDHGELSEVRRAVLPLAAAVGGMIVPAAIYTALAGEVAPRGWGVPMATDIAFALGVLALLGKRVPPALRVLLLALAVVDDLGAILVIAIFYSGQLHGQGVFVALVAFGVILLMQRFGVRRKLAYVPPAVAAWGGIYLAGVHPTIAGVLIGLVTPVRAWLGPGGLVREAPRILDDLVHHAAKEHPDPHALAGTLGAIDHLRREAMSPAESLIEMLHPWVAFGIMPVFALANAGVALGELELAGEGTTVAVGVGVGLVVGKALGVVGACWLSAKLGVAVLPRGLGTRHLLVLGAVAGVGFTMALFVAGLAFEDPAFLGAAKLGVLAGSLVAGLGALALGRVLLPEESSGGAASADEAESSTEL